jgi:hypothetical protein
MLFQLKMCDLNRQHFKSTGDVASSNKFQQVLKPSRSYLFIYLASYLFDKNRNRNGKITMLISCFAAVVNQS